MLEIYGRIENATANAISYEVSRGQPVQIKINSPGGDVFAGLTAHNLLKGKGATIEIVGLCASAASLIACAGQRVLMASNGLMMIHNPQTLLVDYYDKDKLAQLQSTFAKLEESILSVYRSRVAGFEMPTGELWLNAAQAKELGFVDEITGEVPGQVEMTWKGASVMGEDFFSRIKAAITEGLQPTASTREAELARIRELQGLKCDDAAVNAVVDVAIGKGQSVAEVVDYVNAIKNAPRNPDMVADKIISIIKDQMTSGAINVGSSPAPTDDDIKKAQMAKIIEYANGGRKS